MILTQSQAVTCYCAMRMLSDIGATFKTTLQHDRENGQITVTQKKDGTVKVTFEGEESKAVEEYGHALDMRLAYTK